MPRVTPYPTDRPWQHVQGNPKALMDIARAPDEPSYRHQWDHRLPKSRHESFDKVRAR